MRILWLLARRVPDVPSPLVVEVSRRLRLLGHEVDAVLCEDELTDVRARPAYDLCVLKSHTDLALSVATACEGDGARVLNAAAACARLQDKYVATGRLARAGIPVPRTHVTGSWDRVAELAGDAPVLVKPVRGHRGVGVEVVPEPQHVRDRPPPETPLLVQEVVPGPGEDLKVYVVGRRVWTVRKRFSPTSFSRPGRPVPVADDVRELALAVGEACDLTLFGLDVIESPRGPVVVDVNYLPGYKGCRGVAGPMTELVQRAGS